MVLRGVEKNFLSVRTRARLAPPHPKPVPFLENRSQPGSPACCAWLSPVVLVPVLKIRYPPAPHHVLREAKPLDRTPLF